MKPLIIAIGAILICIFSCAPIRESSVHPDCTDPERWPASMALVFLKNKGIIRTQELNFEKTKIIRMASEQIGSDLFRQIHHIIFVDKSGKTIEVMTVNEASREECSMSEVEAYWIQKISDR